MVDAKLNGGKVIWDQCPSKIKSRGIPIPATILDWGSNKSLTTPMQADCRSNL